ncbi:hypothetical protein [Trinickia dinghuensis]|uniref:Uncharacterized protein n=1 Tax=Trinickia dinghuensis TaxID=2291023 RepID=A0A3D8K221_9BURK|nr:hypothetical protein [Trinickia dinghuensis]RDU99190.1 hypothetical protein DWV00_08680 [Trinickia dinghuensis]
MDEAAITTSELRGMIERAGKAGSRFTGDRRAAVVIAHLCGAFDVAHADLGAALAKAAGMSHLAAPAANED